MASLRSALAVWLLGLGLLGSAAGAQPAEVVLTVLSYNTHGLPAWLAGDDPEARFPRIARLCRGYELVLLQEDFGHHALLLEGSAGRIVERGNDAGSRPACPVCNGSGLTLLADPTRLELLGIDREPYGVCAGWLRGGSDCFATKGFQHARLALANERLLHVVNTHLDAGGRAADQQARRRQLDRLAEHLERQAAGAALLAVGDFNLAADDEVEAALLASFRERLGLRDSGAGPAPGTPWRHLDYILVRSGTDLEVEVLEAGEAPEFDHEGEPLSDHPAIRARLRLRAR